MSSLDHQPWQHDHRFGQQTKRPGELRTLIVILLTAITMVLEIAAGIVYGSMALLADGLHMASHAAALSIAAFAYVYARRHADDPHYSFGSGKVNALGGYTGAVLLAVFSAMMAWESLVRLAAPVAIAFDQAIFVAVLGLLVNGVSALVLSHRLGHTHAGDGHSGGDRGDSQTAQHTLAPRPAPQAARDAAAGLPHAEENETHSEHHHDDHGHHHDHNLGAAYLHVLADALTSLLAILALVSGKYGGWNWMDPSVGLLGALLVGRWSLSLLRSSSQTLLDRQAPQAVLDAIRTPIEALEATRVEDLHVWSIGPAIYAAEIVIVSRRPESPETYRQLIPQELRVVHAAIEIHSRASGE